MDISTMVKSTIVKKGIVENATKPKKQTEIAYRVKILPVDYFTGKIFLLLKSCNLRQKCRTCLMVRQKCRNP